VSVITRLRVARRFKRDFACAQNPDYEPHMQVLSDKLFADLPPDSVLSKQRLGGPDVGFPVTALWVLGLDAHVND
jgi:hypothetical protein